MEIAVSKASSKQSANNNSCHKCSVKTLHICTLCMIIKKTNKKNSCQKFTTYCFVLCSPTRIKPLKLGL